MAIRVAAAPWATPWAFAGYAIVLAAVVLGLVRVQQRKLQREAEYARVLEQRVQERTRELSERQQELERVNDELAQASITDSLTGLANRRFLAEYIEKEVALLHRRYHRLAEGTMTTDLLDLAFVMIDIDNFKVVNDTAGHAAGDAVLRQFRDLLNSVSRTSDIIVRWGGDEFLIVARDLSDEGQAELAERIRARAEQHVFEIGEGRVIRTTCSVGFALLPVLPGAARRAHLGAGGEPGRSGPLRRQGERTQRLGRLPPGARRAADPGPVRGHLPRHPAAGSRRHAPGHELAARVARPRVGVSARERRLLRFGGHIL